MRKTSVIALLASALMLSGACASNDVTASDDVNRVVSTMSPQKLDDQIDNDSGGLRSNRTTTNAPDPFAQLVRINPTSSCPVQGDLEGRFNRAQMSSYVACILPNIDAWIDFTYTGMDHPAAYWYVPPGVTMSIATSEGVCPVDDEVLQYCGNLQMVFLGESSVWKQYSVYGDAALPVVVAHEVGHHFQDVLGIIGGRGNLQIPNEKQADCVAGAFMDWARDNGVLNADDIVDLSGSLTAAGEAEGPGREHGTVLERIDSFNLSYTSRLAYPLKECVAIVASPSIFPTR